MKNNNSVDRNKIVDIRKSSSGKDSQQTDFINSLNQAIKNNELCLHYQPRFNVATGKANVVEALVRWFRSAAGLFYPEVFIPVAEKSGLIFALDLWVFECCCKDLKRMQQTINAQIKIAVNVSVLACENIFYVQKIIALSEKYNVPLSCFEFEITESTHIHDIRKVISFCETLKNYGAEFSLDDFGTGQSPLINLYKLPVDTIKIDRVFIQGIGQSKFCEIIILSLVKMAKNLGLKTVAEGIEDKAQYDFMSDSGCDQLQGFLLCRPVSSLRLKSPMLYEPDMK